MVVPLNAVVARSLWTAAVVIVLFGSSPAPPTLYGDEPIVISAAHVKLIQQAEIPALQPGLLLQLEAREGRSFEAGETLARTDDREARLDLAKARVELAIAERQAASDEDLRTAEKEYEVAARNLDRAKRSIDKFEGSISDADKDQYELKATTTKNAVEKARAERDLAKLNVDVRKNQVDLAQARLDRHRLQAPFAGLVVDVRNHVGEWVEPGETVLRLIRLDRLRAEGFLPADVARPELVGCRTRLRMSGSKRIYYGEVVFVSPEVDPVTKQVRVYAEIDNADRKLRPGVNAQLSIDPNSSRR